MKRKITALIAMGITTITFAFPGMPGKPGIPGVPSPFGTPVYDAQSVQKMALQLVQLENSAKHLKAQLDTMKTMNVARYQLTDISPQLTELDRIIKSTSGLAYEANNINSTFKSVYPGYQTPNSYEETYQGIIDKTQNTLQGSMLSLAKQNTGFSSETLRVQKAQNDVRRAVGAAEAIQGASQIAAEEIAQLQLLRQTVMAQVTAQNAYYAAQIQKEASARAELNDVISHGRTSFSQLNAHPVKYQFGAMK
jgi:P-type conjugative transfer protein TrbJ